MRVRHLTLEDFRSYESADLDLTSGITAFVGLNGAGKTNILEAIHLIARGDSARAGEDAQMVRWGTAVGRVRVTTQMEEEECRLEVLLFAPPSGERRRPRRWLMNGVGKRADDVIGELKVVAFFPEDVMLLSEAPSARRRYLDAMIGQVDRRHRADSREYQRVLEQRNALLKSLRDSGRGAKDAARSPEMAFWNEAITRLGGQIAQRRADAVRDIRPAFTRAIAAFTPGRSLDVTYSAQVEGASAVERSAGYLQLIEEKGEREVWQGTTLIGPHREDLSMTGEGRSLPSFASRGEHRSAVVSLKLAEAEWLAVRSRETPVFLLDDVLSELDPWRREALVEALPRGAQVLVTASLPAGLPPSLLVMAEVRQVEGGRVGSAMAP